MANLIRAVRHCRTLFNGTTVAGVPIVKSILDIVFNIRMIAALDNETI